jgi:hypothetical protein
LRGISDGAGHLFFPGTSLTVDVAEHGGHLVAVIVVGHGSQGGFDEGDLFGDREG